MFSLSPCDNAFTLTSAVAVGDACQRLLNLFDHFCQQLDIHCVDFLSAILCSEPRNAERKVVYQCIFFPTSRENWIKFRSSKLFASIKESFQEISAPQRSPTFNELKIAHLWDQKGNDVLKDASIPEVHSLEQIVKKRPEDTGLDSYQFSNTLARWPDLERFERFFEDRYRAIQSRKLSFINCPTTGKSTTFLDAARFGTTFGCVRDNVNNGVVFRDWVTGNVDGVVVRGEFSDWDDCKMTLEDESQCGYHTWSYFVPDVEGASPVVEGTKYQFKFIKGEEVQYRVPAYARYVHIDESNGNVDARVLVEDRSCLHTHQRPPTLTGASDVIPIVYECHIGTSTESSEHIGSFKEFQDTVLPRVAEGGYNTICFMGISQGSSYSTFGWHVTAHYAPDIAFGTPDDIHRLINACHKRGIRVWLSLVHSHCAPIAGGGLQDYMQWNTEGYCPAGGAETTTKRFDAKQFALERHEVLRYLLGSIVMWAESYRADGIRIENLHTMIFHHQGVGLDFGAIGLDKHFDHEANMSAHVYIALCSLLCKELNISCTATTECESPLLTTPIEEGGLGIDYIFSTAAQKAVRSFLPSGDWSSHLSVSKLVSIAKGETTTGNRTISCASNWDCNIYARRVLKIAMFSWETLYTHPIGGVAPHVTELAAGLSRLGHEVHIFTRSTTQTANHSIHHGVHLHECPMQLNADFVQEIRNMCSSLQGHMLQTEQYMNDTFAIVHAHDWLAAPAIDGLKEMGRTTVQTMHSTEYGRCGNQIFGGQSRTVRDIEGRACDYADRVICVSGVLADEIKELFNVHPEKIRVVYNGINATNWDGFEDAATIKARYGISAMQPMLLFVGRMVLQKGPDLLVDALGEVVGFRSDVVVVMVGDGHMLDELKARTDDMGLGANVKWLGKKGGAELRSLYKACDAVLVPSRNEPFGIVVLEAWACYKPVVATTCGGPRDFVSHDIEGFLVDPNPGSVAWGIKQILSNFEHTRWMGERGRVKAAFSFTWDTIATETRDVYLELLNRQDAPYGVSSFRSKVGEQTLVSQLVGPLLTSRMSVFDQCYEVQRGIDVYNMIRFFVAMSSQGFMTFMGTEFGQPDILDLPRPGNHFSKVRARTDWSLSTATDLKFKYILYFDSVMNHLLNRCRGSLEILNIDEISSTIVLQKGPICVIFNFGNGDYDEFNVGHKFGAAAKLKIILASSEERFSGRPGYEDINKILESKVLTEEPNMDCKEQLQIKLEPLSLVVVADVSQLRGDIIPQEPVDQWLKSVEAKTQPPVDTKPTPKKQPVADFRQESVGRLRNRI
eukprot:GHVH01008320.1.p1 GENE.GHVH01008320.1~~GHVH01008320.1.p1  ORF type:complete len:1493 (+),score=195.77 GHVH01008320.1:592-4479(+)